jgi:hypothetical protein
LSEIAKTIRSKNAGVDKITFDVIFPGRASYERVRQSGGLSRAAVCDILRIDEGKSPTTSNSTRQWPSSSRSTAGCQAAAPQTLTSSAASNMARCSTSKYRTVEALPRRGPPDRLSMASRRFAIGVG